MKPAVVFVQFGTNSPNVLLQIAQLHDRMQAAASRGAEEVDELRGGYEDRMSAMRAELQQQEVDKAALLDIVQVWTSLSYAKHACCCRSACDQAHISTQSQSCLKASSASKAQPAHFGVTV